MTNDKKEPETGSPLVGAASVKSETTTSSERPLDLDEAFALIFGAREFQTHDDLTLGVKVAAEPRITDATDTTPATSAQPEAQEIHSRLGGVTLSGIQPEQERPAPGADVGAVTLSGVQPEAPALGVGAVTLTGVQPEARGFSAGVGAVTLIGVQPEPRAEVNAQPSSPLAAPPQPPEENAVLAGDLEPTTLPSAAEARPSMAKGAVTLVGGPPQPPFQTESTLTRSAFNTTMMWGTPQGTATSQDAALPDAARAQDAALPDAARASVTTLASAASAASVATPAQLDENALAAQAELSANQRQAEAHSLKHRQTLRWDPADNPVTRMRLAEAGRAQESDATPSPALTPSPESETAAATAPESDASGEEASVPTSRGLGVLARDLEESHELPSDAQAAEAALLGDAGEDPLLTDAPIALDRIVRKPRKRTPIALLSAAVMLAGVVYVINNNRHAPEGSLNVPTEPVLGAQAPGATPKEVVKPTAALAVEPAAQRPATEPEAARPAPEPVAAEAAAVPVTNAEAAAKSIETASAQSGAKGKKSAAARADLKAKKAAARGANPAAAAPEPRKRGKVRPKATAPSESAANDPLGRRK